jgi:hypothetical protein
MNTKDFKKLLKESISNGATYILDEQEEIPDSIAADEETQTQPEQDSEEASNKLADSLKKAAEEVAKFIQNKDLNAENLAKAMAYYFIGMYWDEPQNWEASVKSNSIFNRNLNIVLSNRLKDRTNIICLYSDLLEWLNKFYKSPEVLANKIERDVDGREVSKIKSALDANLKGSYRLTGNNSNILKQMIAYNKDYDITRCVPGEELEGRGEEKKKEIRTKDQQPMSLESLKAVIEKTDAKDYATRIINALKQDMKDLRVKVNEAREKTPLLTNTIRVLQSIPDKDIQKSALKSILDFFRVNNLQISGKTQSKLTKAGILTRQDDEPTEDTPSEEEDLLKTPEEKQTIRDLYISLRKVTGLNYFTKQIIDALRKDVPKSLSTSLGLRKALKEEEEQTVVRSAENIINLLQTIKDQGNLKIAKMAYIVISRYLSRNGIKLNQRDKNKIKSLRIVPDSKEEIMFLLDIIKPLERNLEEQRYRMLLKRLKIK